MGTILASTIISKAQTLIQDTDAVRWPVAELLEWLNEGQREVVLLKPDAFITTEAIALVPGTKQSIPAEGILIIDIIRNMGTDGLTHGKAIRPIRRTVLDEQLPDWHSSTASPTALYAVYSEKNPKVFFVYPPQPDTGMGYVEVAYSSSPTDIAASTNAITINDIFAGGLVDYLLYRAWSKDAEYAGNEGRAASHYTKFLAVLSAKEKMESAK